MKVNEIREKEGGAYHNDEVDLAPKVDSSPLLPCGIDIYINR